MQSDEPTLAEPLEESLLRAGFDGGDESAALARRALQDPEPRHRVLALRAIVRRCMVTPDDWLVALGDYAPEVRREALGLVAYATLEDPRITTALEALLDDPDPLVVDAAAFALGEHHVVEAVSRLCAIASVHDDARCRESAVAALGSIGDDRGRATVLAALDDKPPVRRRAIVALTNFEGPDIEAALARAAQDRDWQVRAAVDQLGRGEI